jgi:ketopantoate reductase
VVNEVSRIGQTLHPELGEELSLIGLDGFVEEVIQDNPQNKSSRFNDVKRQHRTQVDNLNEYIVRKGRELGIVETPADNELLMQILAYSGTKSACRSIQYSLWRITEN